LLDEPLVAWASVALLCGECRLTQQSAISAFWQRRAPRSHGHEAFSAAFGMPLNRLRRSRNFAQREYVGVMTL